MGKVYNHLSLQERHHIEALLKAKMNVKQISEITQRSEATIRRELKRGKTVHRNTDYIETTIYAAELAEFKYRENLKLKGRNLKIGNDIEYADFLEHKMKKEKYSPQAALYAASSENKFKTKICKVTLYSYIYKGVFWDYSKKDLPYSKKKKKKSVEKQAKRKCAGTSIEKRDKSIDTRQEFGHWEMDSVVGPQGKSNKTFLVLTERKTRDEIVKLMKNHSSSEVVKALNHIEKQIGTSSFRKIFKTITVDNGTEFSDAENMAKARRSNSKRTEIYYCHPYRSSERASNENNNKLVRRHKAKGIIFDDMSSTQVRYIQDWMNTYPREMFDGKSASELFLEEIQNIDFGTHKKSVYDMFMPRGVPNISKLA